MTVYEAGETTTLEARAFVEADLCFETTAGRNLFPRVVKGRRLVVRTLGMCMVKRTFGARHSFPFNPSMGALERYKNQDSHR